MEELLARSQAGLAQGLRRELDALFMQEEAGFVARRLSDSYSLRRKSEQATAGAVASRLIAETKLETDKAIRALEEGLRGAPDDPAGQARIDPSRWQQSFAVALEAGLAKWDAAEERLLVERVEWELQAGRDYGDGDEAWAAAWKEMEAQRSRWEAEIRAVLAEGEAAWREEQAGLVAAIHSAAEEFERSAAGMFASRSQEIEGLINMFAQASQMVATARSSGRYWLDKLDVQLELDDPYEDIEGAARAPSDGTSTESALEQVRYWRDVLDTYSSHVDVARERLASLSATILNDDGSAGPLEEVLFGTSPDSLLLDEYQVELLRAQAVAEYWERQLTIAEAVDRYARDTSSARATEAETEASYREALELYSARKADYDRAVEMLGQLDTAGSSTEARRAVEVASSALEEARLHRDVACEIYEYASNGYLGASGDSDGSTGAWRSPEEQLQFARNGYERARAALAVLRNVVADSQSERGSGDLEYIQSRNAYQAALERYLALRREQGNLLEEISRQGAAVEQAQRRARRHRATDCHG